MINKPKKSLGQNFLINPKVAERIAKEANLSKGDIVLEIGPGTGNLTKYLLLYTKRVVAVEKDDKLFEDLQKKFANQIKSGSLVLVRGDILKFNTEKDILQNYKIVANIPYNITGLVFKKFLTAENQPKSMTLMIQREVAQRIMVKNKKESLLSISVGAYGKPELLFKVSRGNFHPAPNVDSAVIGITGISRKIFEENGVNEEKFWKIVKAGFAHKRKKLSGNLKNVILDQKNGLSGFADKRAEDLSISDWIILAKV